MSLSIRPHLPLLLAALGSGVVSWLAFSRGHPHAAGTGKTASVETLSAAPEDQKPLPPSLSGAGTADFLAAVRTANPGELRQTWLSEYDLARRNAVIARWASVDPRGCWEFLKSQSLGRATDYTLVANAYPLLFDIWMRSDHAAARDAYIQQTKEGIEGAVALSTLVRSASMAGVEAWTALLSDPRFSGFSVTNWGNSSPVLLADATDALRQMESYTEAEKQGRTAFLNACRADAVTGGISPESALSAYQALSAQGRSDYGESLGRSLAKQDVAKGAAIVEGLPPGERGNAAQGLVTAWAGEDAAASWKWLNERVDGDRTRAASAWAGYAPLQEAARILQASEPSSTTDAAAARVARRMTSDSTEDTGRWIRSLPDPGTRRAAWREIALLWADAAPEQAIAALTAADAPALTNNLYRQVTESLAAKSPEKAREFVSRLPPDRAWFAAKGLEAPKRQ